MLGYMTRRVLIMVPTLFVISIISFAIIQLPPGDYLTTMVAEMEAQGNEIDEAQLDALRERYGLGESFFTQYYRWITNVVFHLDFGHSFDWNRPVSGLVGDRLALTVGLSIATILFIWIVAFPIGVYSAMRQHSVGDYAFTMVGFIGLAVPNFMIALVLMWIGLRYFGQSPGGIVSPEYADAAWNLGKVLDVLGHLWVPIVVWGTAGTAGLIRILRNNLLDELRKPYVVAARARGVPETRLTVKYPLRVALNPFFSTIGWILASLIGADAIVSRVLNLDTTGPLLLRALMAQDMYLAGSLILISAVLVVLGTLLSDLLLGWLDPRVRFRYGR
ncbi:ABC transporter permease [Actinobacteria bacterium YIM 96077]|uniref:ABC transporter permease n=1 Tax=Phytoactinopolyspora halophila TaxID=1981511 RepID=A0A329QAQ5_9ACTN|nr:ABC transporter permease [Phytoactinopolyspora halophila]AYY13965.1 ABC transporter permease [Actinobacteria bacterium YIM 96077]RAW09404.1 ABC transporter permease [Phytoactinopolyspora halophila]